MVKSAKALVRERLMLEEDLPRQHQAAVDDTLARLRAPQAKGESRVLIIDSTFDTTEAGGKTQWAMMRLPVHVATC